MSALKVLITGGAGFIGSRLARSLARDGHEVVVLDSLHPQVHGDDAAPPDLPPGCRFVRADVRDARAVGAAMEGADVVHHFAAETGVGQSQYEIERYVSVNTCGTAVVLEAAVAHGRPQVVIASSRAVYGEGQYSCAACELTFGAGARRAEKMDAGRWEIECPRCRADAAVLPMAEDAPSAPTSVYGVTKVQQEQLATCVGLAHSLPVTLLRFFNVYGPGQSMRNPYVGVLGVFFRRALSGEVADIYEDGRMLRDFVYVDDVVEAARLSTGNERVYGETVNVGTGEAVTLHDVAGHMFGALGLAPRLEVSGRYRLGDVRHAVADASRLRDALGFTPQVTFARGIKSYVEWAASQNREEAADTAADARLAAFNLLRQGAR